MIITSDFHCWSSTCMHSCTFLTLSGQVVLSDPEHWAQFQRSPSTLLATLCIAEEDGHLVWHIALCLPQSPFTPVACFSFPGRQCRSFPHLSSKSDRQGKLRKSKQCGQSEPGLPASLKSSFSPWHLQCQ